MAATAHHDLVLVGGGHSHALVLRRLSMRPVPGLRLTLISPDSLTAYSGMLPGMLAGRYQRQETHIDLSRLSRAAGARWLPQRVLDLDPTQRRVQLDNGDQVEYDTLSLDVGATPDLDSVPGARAHAVPVKPVATFEQRWRDLLADPAATRRVAVVGAGAGGTELAAALAQRLGATTRIGLISAGELLPGYPARARSLMRTRLRDAGVHIVEHAPVQRVSEGQLHYNGRSQAVDLVFWCTGTRAPAWLAASGLPCDERGFLRVDTTLTSLGSPHVHAAGDCASFPSPLPKAGVYAVRQAPVLADNLLAAARGGRKRPYRPQRRFLSLLSAGAGDAVASRPPWPALAGPWVWRWKDRIDRAFMKRFDNLPAPMPAAPANDDAMHCAGCGAKVGATTLSHALDALRTEVREDIEAGVAQGDDAAIIRWSGQYRLVQSVDYFPAFMDEPYLFGRVAALHSLSDIYAMNADPHSALATLCIPRHHPRLQGRDLRRLLAGAVDELNRAHCTLVGGHTIEGPEMAAGFTINGALSGAAWSKNGARPGQVLIITKPLGVGIQLAAWMRNVHRGPDLDATLATMLQSNGPARAALSSLPLPACTDITGFGLLGHLLELCQDSQVSARISLDTLPILPGTLEHIRQGIHSTLRDSNDQVLGYCNIAPALRERPELVAATDPQTSGGLLLAVTRECLDTTLEALRGAGVDAIAIGETLVKNHKASSTITLR
ncbi:selenide, water dikinase SelD [Alcanivorax sp. 24]|nr:selenide, water dikinase SelD [Alcanivorax sp. 24]